MEFCNAIKYEYATTTVLKHFSELQLQGKCCENIVLLDVLAHFLEPVINSIPSYCMSIDCKSITWINILYFSAYFLMYDS